MVLTIQCSKITHPEIMEWIMGLEYLIEPFKYEFMLRSLVTALGHGLIGAFGNNNDLLETLKESGEETGEKIWFMPLDETSKKQNRSKVADIKNTGGRPAGSVTAAHFIGEFVGDTPWVHLDIAGTAMSSSSKGWIPQGATGFPCRTLIETVLRLQN